MKKDSQNIDLQTIKAYLNGELNAEEQFQVEKAALDDPFLSDAIDGWRITDHEQATAKLNSIGKKERNQLFTSKKALFVYAAASISLLILSTSLFFFYSDYHQENTIASVNEPPLKENPKTLEKSEFTEIQTIQAPKAKNQTSRTTVVEINSSNDSAEEIVDTDLLAINRVPYKKLQIDKPQKDIRLIKPNAIIYDTLSGDLSPQVRSQMLAQRAKTPTVASKFENKYAEEIPENAYKATNNQLTQGYLINPKKSEVSSDQENIAAERNQSLDMVEIAQKRIFDTHTDRLNAIPLIGWNKYKKHIHQEISKTYDEHSGNVTIKIAISPNGEIQINEIEKSLNTKADSIAMDVILNGPLWLPKIQNHELKSDTVSIRVRFP